MPQCERTRRIPHDWQRHRCYFTSYHQNNLLGNSSELISMRLGPGDNMMMVAAAASTREPHLRSFTNCACVDVFIISEFVSLSFSFFLLSSLSLTNIYSLPLVRIRSSHDSPVVTVNWSIIITLYYTSRAVVMQALYSFFRYFSKIKGERNFANIEQI